MTDFMTPAHYVLEDGSDSMDLIAKILGKEQFKGFLRGNALKYLIRYEQKGGADDLFKAMDYIERLVDLKKDPVDRKAEKPCKSDLYSIVEVAEALNRHFRSCVE